MADKNTQYTKTADRNRQSTAVIGIKQKLFAGFAIPLVFIIIIGVVTYSLAASGMAQNYEDSMSKAMIMAMEYLDFGFESAVSESEQLYYDTELVRWATGSIYNEWTRKEVAEKAQVDLNVKQKGNEFVENVYIIPGESLPVVSNYDNSMSVPGFYKDLEGSDEGACLKSLDGDWVGHHSYIDSVLSKSFTDFSSDSYACSYIRPMTTKRACIVVDYSSETITDILKNLDLGEGSYTAFVTADGRELLMKDSKTVNKDKFSFTDQSFYKDAMKDKAATIIEYVTYDHKDYLFMVSKSYNNGSSICAMVPVSLVNEGANSIKTITFFIVILSWVIAGFAGIYIIRGITTTIRHISNKLKIVSSGDLTVTSDSNRRDEFRVLDNNLADMVKNSRDLIFQVNETAQNVSASTEKLAEASEKLSSSSGQISTAVSEMDNGMSQQAQGTQDSLVLMDELSKRITQAVKTVQQMDSITGSTKHIIAGGMSTMDDLKKKSADTTNITMNVTDNIQKLEGSLAEIEKFVEMINGIAEETSLLALNASIEAARAGEAGKGFAVVAQSVSKLSEGTIDAANEIQNVMEQIKDYAVETVHVAKEAENIVSMQSDTVHETINVFKGINTSMERLMSDIASLEDTIENMEKYRNDTLAAIESISSVSEETAASVAVVNDSLHHQVAIVDNLSDSTLELEKRAKELTEAVHAFKI